MQRSTFHADYRWSAIKRIAVKADNPSEQLASNGNRKRPIPMDKGAAPEPSG
jgi:hypothetical protein